MSKYWVGVCSDSAAAGRFASFFHFGPEPRMVTFRKFAWLMLCAGSACLPFAGCSKEGAFGGRFQTQSRLEKTAPAAAPATSPATDVAATQPPAIKATADNKTPVAATPAPSPAGRVPSGPSGVRLAEQTQPSAKPGNVSAASASKVSGSAVSKSPQSPTPKTPDPKMPSGAAVAMAQRDTFFAARGAAGALGESKAVRKVQLLIPQKTFRTEGPEGAVRVSYDDIDLLKVLNIDPVPANAADKMPAWLKGLDGRRVRIRGFMYPTFQQTGVHAFGLARDNQICCFGRNPKIYDVFDVLCARASRPTIFPTGRLTWSACFTSGPKPTPENFFTCTRWMTPRS